MRPRAPRNPAEILRWVTKGELPEDEPEELPVRKGLIQIAAPHFTAGVVLANFRVTDAAPVVKYMRGWRSVEVLNYCRRKGWRSSLIVDR